MSSVSKRTGSDGRPSQWVARWREADGKQRKKSFNKKSDAERFLTQIEHRILKGEYVSPNAGKITVGSWAATWLGAQSHLKPSTYARYESLLRYHVLARWERVKLQDVRHADIQGWVAALIDFGLAPGSVRQAFRVFHLVLGLAVKDGRLARNLAEGVQLPKARRTEPRFLTPDQVGDLVEAGGGLEVLVLAYTGLRFGELSALRVADIDVMRGRIRVHRSGTEVKGVYVEGTPKTSLPRSVPLPRFLCGPVAELMGGHPRTDRVFTSPDGGPLRINNWSRRRFKPACATAGLEGLRVHDLRHTAASLAVQSGASVKAVQRMLGHASAAMTLDVYAGLFSADLDDVAARMDALAPRPRPTAPVTDLNDRRDAV